MGNVGVMAGEVRGQILKGLVVIAKNFGFYPEGCLWGHLFSPPSVLNWTVA